MDEFWGIDDVPRVSVDLVAVGDGDVQIVVETDSVHLETVHVHFNIEEVPDVQALVGGDYDLEKTLVVG